MIGKAIGIRVSTSMMLPRALPPASTASRPGLHRPDALAHGARLRTGGKRIGNAGYFFSPDVPADARIMNEEPFGPVVLINRFGGYEATIGEANRLEYGLAAHASTTSVSRIAGLPCDVDSGMLSVTHQGLDLAEMPFGGVTDSGYGSEGGPEAMETYLTTKVVTQDIHLPA